MTPKSGSLDNQDYYHAQFSNNCFFLNPGVPSTAVYLVKPLLIASIAASLMC